MFTIAEIARATGGRIIGSGFGEVSGVSTDSRTVEPGQLFVPLRGERFDGHDYLTAAFGRGATVFLADAEWVEKNAPPESGCCIVVTDTLRALGDLAAFHRARFSIPVVGVTGSNGKTTTKEMIASILGLTGEGLKTAGNLNNLIGLPRMLFDLNGRHKWAVLEMGMSEPGEIDRLAEMARPQIGVITNAFAAHLESMGSVEAVARAKGELFLRLPPDGCGIYNAENPLVALLPVPAGVKRLGFGISRGDVTTGAIKNEGKRGVSFSIALPSGDISVSMRVFGVHNVSNALAAAAAAYALGVAPETIKRGLEAFNPYDKRFNLEELAGVVLVDDSYNANPASMEAALRTVSQIKEDSAAVAVLGDMLELGEGSREAHRAIGKLAASCVDLLYAVGEMAEITAGGAIAGGLSPAAVHTAKDHAEMIDDLLGRVGKGEFILVKGSRGMRMETVSEALRARFKPDPAKGKVA